MRLAFAIPWRDLGDWLFAHLPPEHEGTLLFAAPEPSPDGPRASRLPPYLAEFVALLRRGYHLRDFDVVLTWELRCTVAIALLRKLQRARKTRFVAVGPILKGGVLRFLPLVRWLLADAETIVCFASAECERNATLLHLPRARFVFLPTPWEPPRDLPPATDGGYVLALGQSHRDYATLFKAVADLPLPVTVVAADATPFGGEQPPANVTVRFNTGHAETSALIAAAQFLVIPLHPGTFSAGQTVLLRGMASGKAAIVTETAGVRDYVDADETALLVPPHDPVALRATILQLTSSPERRRRLGDTARHMLDERFRFASFLKALLQQIDR